MPSVAPEMLFDVERGPDWLLVSVRNIDEDGLGPVSLAEGLESLLERHSTHRLVLQLDNVDVLTSHLVSELIRLQNWVCCHGGLMRLAGLSSMNQQVLHACQLEERFHPYATWEEAVRGYSTPHYPR